MFQGRPAEDHENDGHRRHQRPLQAQRQKGADKPDNCSEVPRMADVLIRAGHDQMMSALRLNAHGRTEEAIDRHRPPTQSSPASSTDRQCAAPREIATLGVMNFFALVLLAVIQGVTELLPVSSSAHVIMAERLMGLDPGAPDMTFLLVMLHTGTMGAVLVYFWPRWRQLLVADPRFSFLKMVVLATAWTGVLGLGLKVVIEKLMLERIGGYAHAEVEQLFRNLPLIGLSVFAVGLVILMVEQHEASAGHTQVNGRQATLIGIVQALCLPFRGFSRSGATISTALRCGVSRSLAEDFSFALAVLVTPPVVALELQRLWHAQTEAVVGGMGMVTGLSGLIPGVVGMALSFGAGLVALHWLSAVLEQGRWRYFGYYCLVASAVVLLGHFVWGL